jgi:hypothetical protein
MRYMYIVFTFSLFGLISCNNGNNANSGSNTDSTKTVSKTNHEPVKSKLNDAGTSLLMAVVNKYYALKNALVATKANSADSAARQLVITADSLQSFLMTDSVNKIALKPFLDTIISQSKAVTSVMDETCEKKRLAFGSISSAMYGLLKSAGLKNAQVYHEYCPMAFNEKGAYWLSDESEIKNPYFGKKMMECGEVTDSL